MKNNIRNVIIGLLLAGIIIFSISLFNKKEEIKESIVLLDHKYDSKLYDNTWYYVVDDKIELYDLLENKQISKTNNYLGKNTTFSVNEILEINNNLYAKISINANEEGYILWSELDKLNKFYNTSSKVVYLETSNLDKRSDTYYTVNKDSSVYVLDNKKYNKTNEIIPVDTNVNLIYMNNEYSLVSIIEKETSEEEIISQDNKTPFNGNMTSSDSKIEASSSVESNIDESKENNEAKEKDDTKTSTQIKESTDNKANTQIEDNTTNTSNVSSSTTSSTISEEDKEASLDGNNEYVKLERKAAIVVKGNDEEDSDEGEE